MFGSEPYCNSGTSSLPQLRLQAGKLLGASLAPSSRVVYRRAAFKYGNFIRSVYTSDVLVPISVDKMITFLACLHSQGLAPATITTYSAALGYFNKRAGFPDVSQLFLVQKTLTGIQRSGVSKPLCNLINLPLLHKLIDAIPRFAASHFDMVLCKSMFLLAFHAFLRVGEFTVRNNTSPSQCLKFNDCEFTFSSGSPQSLTGLEVTLRFFKGNVSRQPFVIFVPLSNHPNYCAVRTMAQYSYLRGSRPGPVFCCSRGTPISRSYFSQLLKQALLCANLDATAIKPHSFRIGAATTACMHGIADQDIQKLGRLKSDAFERYIRIPQFHAF